MPRQRGVATLTVSLAILLLGTLVVLGVAQAVLMELKIANNAVRAAQAFEAAEAGLHAALDYFNHEPDRDGDGSLDPVFDTNGDGTGDASTANVGTGRVTVSARDVADGAMTRIAVTATGYSDDRGARRTIAQTLVVLDPVPHLPRVPLVAGGGVEVQGVLAVRNASGHDTIWAGGAVQVEGGAALTVTLPDTTNASYPECLGAPGGCPLRTSPGIADASVVTNDMTLTAKTTGELFRATFGLDPATFTTSLVTLETTQATFAHDTQQASRDVIYAEGNIDIGDLTIGCTSILTGNAICPDDARRPAVLIIDGDAAFAGDAHVYGLLFFGGAATITGELHVHGAIVATNNILVSGGARLDIAFDQAVFAELHKAGPLTPLAGTWNEG